MNIEELISQISVVTKIMQNNIFDDVNDKFVVRKLNTIKDYLIIRTKLNPNVKYSEIISDKEFQGYIKLLWNPASFTGYYNPKLDDCDTQHVYRMQDVIKTITKDIYAQFPSY